MSYPSRPKLSAITQMATLKRSGLVADCIFPQVKTDCKFSYIDWEKELLANKSVDDNVGCKTDVHEVDSEPFELKDASLKDHALSQVLDECCVTACGDEAAYKAKIEAGKTRQLVNKLLIGREKRAIALSTTTAKYTDNASKAPSDSGAVVDGGWFKLAKTNFDSPNYALLKYLLGIQENTKISGQRNVLVTDRAVLNGLLSHPNFIGAGCMVDPMTTMDKVAGLLGLDKICIADASYHDGLGTTPNMAKFWPANTMLFTTSYDLITPQDETLAFGISAYNRGFQQYTWLEEKKGPQQGALMQKISHDYTEIVLSYKAATLVTLTT